MIRSLTQQEVTEILTQMGNFFWKFSNDFHLQSTVFFCFFFPVPNGLTFNGLRFGEAQRCTWLSHRGKLTPGIKCLHLTVWWFSKYQITAVIYFPK